MKILFYGRNCAAFYENHLDWWLAAPEKLGYTWALNGKFADAVEKMFGLSIPPENRYTSVTGEDVRRGSVMIAVGGDGTFLEAVHELRGLPMPVVGINLGRMGFLAQIKPFEVERAISDILAGRYTLERRTMLTVEGDFPAGNVPDFPCALNEFTLHRHTADMISVAIYSRTGELLTVVRGDGAIASTPTGSTAYAMSAGGPIVTPDCACLVYLGIAPHNFSIRPFVVPDSTVITVEVRSRGHEVLASLDNQSFIVGDGARFTIKKSEFPVFLIRLQNISFYDTLRDRTMWGMDRRDNF
ncbi:MAG: NAD(+)/NADH kinase [Alistipes sp.]|jgi:NAD+ kinase|nr:NAD(+)/NADH kinase [Alistipes sp.]